MPRSESKVYSPVVSKSPTASSSAIRITLSTIFEKRDHLLILTIILLYYYSLWSGTMGALKTWIYIIEL